MRERIIEILKKAQSRPTSIQQFRSYLDLKSGKNFTEFMKALNELEDECVIVADRNQEYRLLEFSDCVKGILRINRKGFGFVDGEEDSLFIPERFLNHAMDQDLVLARVIDERAAGKEGKIIKVLENKRKTIIGNIRNRGGKFIFFPDEETITQNIRFTNMKEFQLVDGHKIACSIVSYGSTLTCKIDRIIGHVNDPGVDIEGVLLEKGIVAEFPDEVMDQVQNISREITEEDLKDRLDLTDKTIITIDGDDAKDLDDAISIERLADGGYRLGVHIADVSHYVPFGSPLDIEAYNRSTSVYVVDRVVPMLPHALCNDLCSLNPKVRRLTLSCIMDFDKNGEVTNYQLAPSVIKSTERMTYHNVNSIFEGDFHLIGKYRHIYGDLIAMGELSQIIRHRREQNGAIDFDRAESEIVLNEKGKVIDVRPREIGFAQGMIEDFMVSANECVARHMRWMEYPCLYRIHENPPMKRMTDFVKICSILGTPWKGSIAEVYPKQFQDLLNQFKDTESYPVLSSWMLRTMSKAKYDPTCLGHFGLGLKEYLHFTSPIRRYPDLIVHRMLRKYFFEQCTDEKELQKDLELMERYALQTSSQERNAVDAERTVDDMKKAEYMESKVGKIFTGVISGLTNFGMFVELPNTIEGLVRVNQMNDDYYTFVPESLMMMGERTGKRYRIGQAVKVQCIGANRYERNIDFQLIDREAREYGKNRRHKS